MKNVMLMMSKIQRGGGTLLTSILVISVLGVLLFLILNRNQKLRCLKKLTGVVLILTMFLLPFSNLLNVWADVVTITTDDTKTLVSDSNFKRVTNTTNILLNNVSEYNEDATKMDTFSAYKILDVYYNKTTNEMNYDFTSDFNTFKKSLDTTDEIYKLDVSGYLQLIVGSYYDDTILTFDKLVSKYTTYIRKQASGTLSSIKFGQGNNATQRMVSNVEVGSYLILPDNVVEGNEEVVTNIFSIIGNTYTVLVGNAVFTAGNGEWNLTDCLVDAKHKSDSIASLLVSGNITDPYALLEIIGNGNYAIDMVYGAKNSMMMFNANSNSSYREQYNFPDYTHDSIKNNVKINEQLGQRKFIFSSGLDIKNIYIIYEDANETFQKVSIRDNVAYFISNKDNTEQKFADIVENDNELDDQGATIGKSITFSKITLAEPTLLFEIVPNDDANVGINQADPDNSGNKIITEMTYLKDPYMDIGSNPTDEDINKVLGIASTTNIVYTYGMNIINQDNNSNVLSGAEFQLYSDKECTIPVGDKITIRTDGTSLFKGIDDSDTYYLKQVKAATGYRLMTDVIEVSKDKLSLTDGIYNLIVTNTKMGLLPSTGGLGTILYTTFGLLIIVVGSITFITYRKKSQVN